MKRFLLWLVGVVLGVGIFLGAVMGVSYAFTTEGGCPDSTAQFGTEALEPNGWCWQVPLIGGKLDKVFASPATLTVQKLGTLYTAHPAITLPDWASYTTLTIRTASGETVFTGTASEYESFLFPANGEYKAELSVRRVPEGGMATQFEGGSTGSVRKNLGLEKPAKPTGWYRYAFRFTLQASAEVELSAERVEQGGIVGLRISGMTGDAAPTVETDLGNGLPAVRRGTHGRSNDCDVRLSDGHHGDHRRRLLGSQERDRRDEVGDHEARGGGQEERRGHRRRSRGARRPQSRPPPHLHDPGGLHPGLEQHRPEARQAPIQEPGKGGIKDHGFF